MKKPLKRNRAGAILPWSDWAVCTENLNPDVVVMKSAKDRV